MFTEKYTDEERENVNSISTADEEVAFDIPYELDNPKVAAYIDKFQWTATYKFSDRMRNPKLENGKSYGSKGMSYRYLYRFLCENFNEGQYFIDDYFEYNYPNSAVKQEADKALAQLNVMLAKEYSLTHQVDRERKRASRANKQAETIRQDLSSARRTKAGNLDMRYKRTRAMLKALEEVENVVSGYETAKSKLSDFKALRRSSFDGIGKVLAENVRQDIILCLASGQIPLSHALSEKTKRTRLSKGLSAEPPFYATGRLIRGITLTYRLEEKSNGNFYRGKL